MSLEKRVGVLEAEVERLRAEVNRLQPKPAPVPVVYPDDEGPSIHTRAPQPRTDCVPRETELRRLHEIVVAAHPRLRCAFEPFCNAFRGVAALGRCEKIDETKSLSWWIDAAQDHLLAMGTARHMDGAAFVAAVLAHGDIECASIDRFPYDLAFGLVQFGGRPSRDSWRAVLANGRPAVPHPNRGQPTSQAMLR